MIYAPFSQLNTASLGALFDNMSESYKIFWFRAILEHLLKGKTEISFEDLANTMIKDAWYMVSEFKLNLGPSDAIEQTVTYLSDISGLKSSEKADKIINFLETCEDKELKKLRTRLCDNVPYRLQAPFIPEIPRTIWSRNYDAAKYINLQSNLIYKFNEAVCEKGAKFEQKKIIINPLWTEYLTQNLSMITGWVDYNLITYLQKRNPNIPGIANKITPPSARNMERVKNYWKAIMELTPVDNIYTGEIMSANDMSIDHFVPWSYVAHDELWNLIPTTKGINSSKSNSLPVWEVYFPRLVNVEYNAYKAIHKYSQVHELKKAVDSVMKKNLNDEAVRHNLYAPGQNIEKFSNQLEYLVQPAYNAAMKMGFGVWKNE